MTLLLNYPMPLSPYSGLALIPSLETSPNMPQGKTAGLPWTDTASQSPTGESFGCPEKDVKTSHTCPFSRLHGENVPFSWEYTKLHQDRAHGMWALKFGLLCIRPARATASKVLDSFRKQMCHCSANTFLLVRDCALESWYLVGTCKHELVFFLSSFFFPHIFCRAK